MREAVHKQALVCRQALPQDTTEAIALTKEIWGGDDYIPFVWQGWLEDPDGLLAVALLDGQVAGLGRLSDLDEGEWWLQGLRVAPALQGRGVASHLHDYLLSVWRDGPGSVLRLTTSSETYPVHHLCERSGFQRVAEYSWYKVEALTDRGHAFSPLIDLEQAMSLAGELERLSEGVPYKYIDLGWIRAETTPQRMASQAKKGQLYTWKAGERARAALAIMRDEDESGPYLHVGLAACPAALLPEFLADCRRLAGSLGLPRLIWTAPIHPVVYVALKQANFEEFWEPLYLYEISKIPKE